MRKETDESLIIATSDIRVVGKNEPNYWIWLQYEKDKKSNNESFFLRSIIADRVAIQEGSSLFIKTGKDRIIQLEVIEGESPQYSYSSKSYYVAPNYRIEKTDLLSLLEEGIVAIRYLARDGFHTYEGNNEIGLKLQKSYDLIVGGNDITKGF